MRNFKIIFSLLITLAVFCSNIVPLNITALADISDTWVVDSATARLDITINNPTATTLTNMPVLIKLNGADIKNKDGVSFYSADELLSSELASYNPSGISTYWVKVPQLLQNFDTVITAYYSDVAVNTDMQSSDVWSDNYGLVQHFSESAVTASKDSTGSGVHTKDGDFTYKKDDIGGATSFTGTQKIAYKNNVIGANATTYSVSAVVKFNALAGTGKYYGIVCRDRNGGQVGDTFMLTLSNSNVNASVYGDGVVANRVNVQKGVAAGQTYILTMTYDGENINLYINGELAGTSPAKGATLLASTESPFTIGAYSDSAVASGLNGDLYDVFFKTSVISADEETFRHDNYLGDAVTLGTLETRSIALQPGEHYFYDAITADTYCFSNGDDGRGTNFGSQTTVMQKRTNVSDAPDFQSSANRRAFIKLDLTEIADINPKSIEAITFDFYQNGNGGTTESAAARIVDIAPDSWDENTVTWKSMPVTYTLAPVATQTLTKKQNEYQSFNITKYISDKIVEGKTEVSFSLDNEPINEWGTIWNSREAADNKPRLTVKIKGPTKPTLSEEVNETAATLTAKFEQDLGDTSTVKFYKTKPVTLSKDNTVVYSGETSDTLPDAITTATADKNDQFDGEVKTTVASDKTPYQIYEIALSEEEKLQKRVELTWTGNTGENQREVSAYFYNHTLNKWVKLNSGSGEGDFSLDMNIPISNALDSNGKMQVLIWRGMNEAIEGRTSYAPNPGQYDFNMMWSTDTQYYTVNEGGMEHVQKQFEWICDNFKDTKSKLFINTGDMVENHDNPAQWQAMSELHENTIEKAKIPYAYVVGNHDVDRHNSSNNIFQNYFPVSRLEKNNSYFGEKFDDMTYYYLMEENGAKIMVMGVGIPVTQEAVDWVNEALKKHPDYTVILMTHIYLLADGTIDNTNKYGAELTIPKVRSIIKDNSNVKLILCGHWHGANTNLEYFDGRPVWSMMHDYQGYKGGGYGYFRFLKFDIENNYIYTHTYSASDNGTAVYTDKQPEKDGLYQKHRDEYAISFDFGAVTERTVSTNSLSMQIPGVAGEQIGTTQTVTGTGSASAVWDNLEEGSTYSWYVTYTDALDNNETSPIQTFTAPKIVIESVTCENGMITVNYTASGISDTTPIGVMAFAAGQGDTADTAWNGQNIAYQDIIAHSNSRKSISFPMPRKTGNGVAGSDTTKAVIIKIGGEYTRTVSKLFTLPDMPQPEISSVVIGENNVNIEVTTPIENGEILIVATYDDAGNMLEISASAEKTGVCDYTAQLQMSDKVKNIKVMWWDGLNNMKPLCKIKTVER